jgi:hypothetical protein
MIENPFWEYLLTWCIKANSDTKRNEFALSSLLRRGTKTWQDGDYNTTIDLVLAFEELIDSIIKYAIYGTEYGSNYRTINTIFNISVLVLKH